MDQQADDDRPARGPVRAGRADHVAAVHLQRHSRGPAQRDSVSALRIERPRPPHPPLLAHFTDLGYYYVFNDYVDVLLSAELVRRPLRGDSGKRSTTGSIVSSMER